MRRVALIIETSRTYGRDLLRGIRRYTQEHEPWSLFVEARDLDSTPPSWLRSWHGDGILTRSGSKAIAAAVRQTGIPAIELRSRRWNSKLPHLGIDNGLVASLVAEHFLERGFQHFGVFALDVEPFFVERRKNFVSYLKQRGFSCSVFRQPGRLEKSEAWESQQQKLMDWIYELPRPTAIMACTDQLGCWLLDACFRLSVRVPEEVAVVGVENDEVIATMSTPPLSSVRFPGEQIGYEAARWLERMMNGETLLSQSTLMAPICVETRQSSDIVAISDPWLSHAIKVIRERACAGLTVADLLAEVPLSRSSLERGFRQFLDRSPNEEIVRIRIDQVCRLLRETDMSLDVIAQRTGFARAQYLLQVFRKIKGATPGAYRRLHKPR
ncbi:DNA-binding transcriptional regulator [Blastopirellula sp. J2-11]|uniref:XylR family transcriptional regulator n=1 Tax=Blastopirellula sp. J2-11 TaxID=2943192 RepID=UPI0021C807E7|nr:DNA-binding transcriptional regulator [Blastopirellula sp. J2-11]UUO07736.1 DNA-binding transcriptional regulator [Blastopirellula sp. J2-11]